MSLTCECFHASKPSATLIACNNSPTAMLSDFGSAEARNAMNRSQRSGTTGTLDYLAPESFLTSQDGRPRQHAAALDIWALGLVLHLLMFFRLPYDNTEDVDELTEEIKAYGGYVHMPWKPRNRRY
jgi:serine/threonine protein kinase